MCVWWWWGPIPLSPRKLPVDVRKVITASKKSSNTEHSSAFLCECGGGGWVGGEREREGRGRASRSSEIVEASMAFPGAQFRAHF